MTVKYSKNRSMKPLTIEDEDGIRIYKGQKLAAHPVLFESLKLLKVLLPSIGSVVDNTGKETILEIPQTWTVAAQMLESNLTEEHFESLVMKTTGSLICNGEAIEDWDEHFDKYIYDLPKVIGWAGEENFADFFTRNHLVRSFTKNMNLQVVPQIKSLFSKIQNEDVDMSSDINKKSGNDI